MCDRETIALLVEAGLRSIGNGHCGPMTWWVGPAGPEGRRERLDHTNADEVGQMLWNENRASVEHRYPGSEELPGRIGETWTGYVHRWNGKEVEAADVFKAADCLEYQSCEHPGWESSSAYGFLQALRRQTWRGLPGYDESEAWQ
jgi:hypothetical protein